MIEKTKTVWLVVQKQGFWTFYSIFDSKKKAESERRKLKRESNHGVSVLQVKMNESVAE